MNGPLAKAILNLIASYIERHGAELLEKLLAVILSKINPETMSFAAGTAEPTLQEFSDDLSALLANPPTE